MQNIEVRLSRADTGRSMCWMDSINTAYLAFDTALEGREISDSHRRGDVKPFGPQSIRLGAACIRDGWMDSGVNIDHSDSARSVYLG